MPHIQRGLLANHIRMTFSIILLCSCIVTFLNIFLSVGSFVPMSTYSANPNMSSLAQYSKKENSLQKSIKGNESVVVPQSAKSTKARQELRRAQGSKVKLNSIDTELGTLHSYHRILAKLSEKLFENQDESAKSAIPERFKLTAKSPERVEQAKSAVRPSPSLAVTSSSKSPVWAESVKATVHQTPKLAAVSSTSSKQLILTVTGVKLTTPFPLGDDNMWNFTVSDNRQPFKYIKTARKVCSLSRHIFLLNIIHSRPANFLHRSIIRNTWGNVATNKKLRAATVFVLGQTNERVIEATVDAEYRKYEDIVQEDFADSYRNLTYKAIAVLRWIVNFCPNAEFILKTDDDVIVNPYDIHRLIRRQLLKEPNFTKIMCHMANRAVIREKMYKWYVSEKEYPYKRYPPFCTGAAFIMPKSVIPLLYNASRTTKFFWFDDVYSTGMLAHIANVSHLNIRYKYIDTTTIHRNELLFGNAAIAHVAGHPNTKEHIKLWYEILKLETNI